MSTKQERASRALTARLRGMLIERGIEPDDAPVGNFRASLVVPVTVQNHHGPSMAEVHAAAVRDALTSHELADGNAVRHSAKTFWNPSLGRN